MPGKQAFVFKKFLRADVKCKNYIKEARMKDLSWDLILIQFNDSVCQWDFICWSLIEWIKNSYQVGCKSFPSQILVYSFFLQTSMKSSTLYWSILIWCHFEKKNSVLLFHGFAMLTSNDRLNSETQNYSCLIFFGLIHYMLHTRSFFRFMIFCYVQKYSLVSQGRFSSLVV